MTCSACSSSRAAPRTLALAGLWLAAACAGPAPSTRATRPDATPGPVEAAGATAPRRAARIALLPVANLSGGPAPVRELQVALQTALRARGLELVEDEAVAAYLAAHRIRYTGGIDKADAKSAGDDLGAAAVLLAAVELHGEDRLSMTARLVSADERAAILWADGATKVANDSPGLFGLGILKKPQQVTDVVVRRLAGSLARYLADGVPAPPACAGGGEFAPRVHYRAAEGGAGPARSVVVLPFRNRTRTQGANERIALEFVRQLASSGELSVIEPGVLRDLLLRFRIIFEGGVALDDVRSILGALDADLIVTGTVFEFVDSRGGGTPRINFTAMLIDARSDEVVWYSTSYNRGTDAVFLFDFGNLPTAHALGCRMVRSAVDGMLEKLATVRAPPSRR